MALCDVNRKLSAVAASRTRRSLVVGTVVLLAAAGAACDSSSDNNADSGTAGGGGGTGGTGAKAGTGGTGGKAGSGGTGGAGKAGSGGTGVGGKAGSGGAGSTAGSGGASGKAGSGGASGSGGAAGTGGMCAANAGGPVTASGPDAHCTVAGVEKKQETNESACPLPADASLPDDDGGAPDFGDTLNGSEGDDDDCKYHLKWTASCIAENTDVTFTVTITKKADGQPVTKAAPSKLDLELYLNDTHLAPGLDKAVYKETSTPGVYTLGPLRFDAAGKWTVRFHVRPDCVDLTEDSPHGHAAFFVNVP
jgi:hypothetical protein